MTLVEALRDVAENGMYASIESVVMVAEYATDCMEKDVGARPVTTTTQFDPNARNLWTITRCGHCNGLLHTEEFDAGYWEQFLKDRYIPKLPGYCKHCGYKIRIPEVDPQ